MLRKFLISLSDEKIAQIALNLGCIAASRKNQEDFIMEQAKTYRWNIADFRSRYNITSQITKDALIECHEAARKHWSNISNKSDL